MRRAQKPTNPLYKRWGVPPLKNELPRDLALRLAEANARAVAAGRERCAVLGADTVVACGWRILPKVMDEHDARTCL